MSAQSVHEAREALRRHAQSLRELVAALDSASETEHWKRVGDAPALRIEALEACTPSERAGLESEVAEVRRWSAIAVECSRRAHGSVAARLNGIARARQALSQLGGRPVGTSCDIAG